MIHNKKGFTVVELLIVISVIAILAIIATVAYNGVRTRAQAAAVVGGLTMLDDAIELWAIKDGFITWPIDPVTGGGTPFANMKTTYPTLGNYISEAPTVKGVQTEDWFYDNEGDIKSSCSAPYNGVNIVIRYVTDTAVANIVDKQLDDGNINCGRVRYVDQRIFYSISYDQTVTP